MQGIIPIINPVNKKSLLIIPPIKSITVFIIIFGDIIIEQTIHKNNICKFYNFVIKSLCCLKLLIIDSMIGTLFKLLILLSISSLIIISDILVIDSSITLIIWNMGSFTIL